MVILPPRFHLFEINDQSWWPQRLRECVQDCLTLLWTVPQPIVTPAAPAELAARTISTVLQDRVQDYVFVDFASGAGGPTAYIEWSLNEALLARGNRNEDPVQFVLSDIAPHISAWQALCKKSENLSYIARPVDAAAAPSSGELLEGVSGGVRGKKKVMRLFSLAFHHFDDELAGKILKNTVDTSDGFCILELQSREPTSFVLIALLWPLLMVSSWWHFRRSPFHLLFTYLVPLIPFVTVFDGCVSCLRTRTPEEVEALLVHNVGQDRLRREGWKLRSGVQMHTFAIGWFNWIICTKERPGG